jgi:hypothetical protein
VAAVGAVTVVAAVVAVVAEVAVADDVPSVAVSQFETLPWPIDKLIF